VTQAGWRPLYDLRLQEENGDSGRTRTPTGGQLSCSGVSEYTGQDWPAVELTVSTARTALNQRLPELNPWYVDFYTPLASGSTIAPAPRVDRMVGRASPDDEGGFSHGYGRSGTRELRPRWLLARYRIVVRLLAFRIPGQTDIRKRWIAPQNDYQPVQSGCVTGLSSSAEAYRCCLPPRDGQ
jgi:hypothetical protein